MLGVLLLPVMAVAGITLWLKRRKARKELEKTTENNEEQNL
jgi:uncharacterized iron-regulated membrane protein